MLLKWQEIQKTETTLITFIAFQFQSAKTGSNAQDTNIFSRTQQLLPETAIQELKAAAKGEVIVRGEAPDEVYRAAIDRWKQSFDSRSRKSSSRLSCFEFRD
jgi:hypothetical protein